MDKTRKGKQIEELARAASKRGIGMTRVDGADIDRMTPRGVNHQGVALKTEKMSVMSISDALEAEENPKGAVWLAGANITGQLRCGGARDRPRHGRIRPGA